MSDTAKTSTTGDQSGGAAPVTVQANTEHNVGKPLLRCCFDASETKIFAAGQDRHIWQIPLTADEKKESVTEIEGHDGWVMALAPTDDGATLLSGGTDGQLIWWSLEERAVPRVSKRIEAHDGWIRDLTLSPDQKLLATGGNDGTVKIWDVAEAKLVQTMKGHEYHIYRIAFHPDGKQLVSGDLTCRIQCWDLDSGKSVTELKTPSLHRIDKNHNLHLGGTRGLCFDHGGKYLAVSGLRAAPNYLGGNVQPGNVILDFAKGEIHQEQKTKNNIETVPWESFFMGDDTLAVAMGGKGGGYLVFWNRDKEDEFYAHKLPDVARDMAVNAKKNRVATAHEDGKLRLSALKIG